MSGRQRARSARWAIVGALGLSLMLVAFFFNFERARGASPHPLEPATPVVVATVERRDIPIELVGIGTVEAYNQVTVKPRISGQITALDFVEGTEVRPGQILARLDDRLLGTPGMGLGLSLVAAIARLHGFGLTWCEVQQGCCIELQCWPREAIPTAGACVPALN